MKKRHDTWLKFWIILSVALTSSLVTMAADKVVVVPLSNNSSLQTRIDRLENLLRSVYRNGDDIYFSGVNVHIIDGSGNTWGPVNGLGNLIVGYNETRTFPPNDRSGSHNIIIGNAHNFSSYGGLVIGEFNNITAPYASVTGGFGNTASGRSSAVGGGNSNTASGQTSTVGGGRLRSVSGQYNWRAGTYFVTN
jgi:hypothetical protein